VRCELLPAHANDLRAQIAAALHTSTITLGRRRTLEDELDGLREGLAHVERVSPDLGAQLVAWLEHAATSAAGSEPLRLCFGHGDFSYTQLIFEGQQSGLVDFDTVCQAEPALDLALFLGKIRDIGLSVKDDDDEDIEVERLPLAGALRELDDAASIAALALWLELQ